ncbi:Phenylalanine--tRNA ligase beta subunit [Thermoplasmatales archaeon]|nr:Phenylalanine--tRNA ligase beta subunit [Thermoplasmatales archaeon]
MVVIRDNSEFLAERFGNNFVDRLQKYASVIGFSVEIDSGTVKVEFNPDRPDLFSFYSLEYSMNIFDLVTSPEILTLEDSDFDVHIGAKALSIRPYFLSLIATGLRLGDSLPRIIEYQERLHETIGRERQAASIGIHSLEESCKAVSYSLKKSDSVTLRTFDGAMNGTAREILNEHPLGKKYGDLLPSQEFINVIEDRNGKVMSIPPISNSYDTRITEDSTRLFIDIEGTDRKSVFQSFFLLAYELKYIGYSISVPRFHGIDKKIITELVAENGREVKFSYDDIARVLGFEPPEDSISEALRKMGYIVTPSYNGYVTTLPGNRVDVMGAVDVIEDIAKGIGYDQIPFSEIPVQTLGTSHKTDELTGIACQLLIGSGYQEVKSFVVGPQMPFSFLKYRGDVTLLNPKSSDFSVVRDRLFVNMMEIIKQNRRRPMPQKIFEIGEVVEHGRQKTHLCFMIHGSRAPFSAAKQVLEYVILRLSGGSTEIRPNDEDGLVTGRSGDIMLDGQVIGFIGEMHPALLELYGIQDPVSLAEIDLSMIA